MFLAAVLSAVLVTPQTSCTELVSIYFEADTVVPSRAGMEIIEHAADRLSQNSAAIVRVTGHDDIEQAGAGPGGVSTLRARVVGEMLVQRGAPKDRTRIVGLGTQARTDGGTQRDALHRRVVIETCSAA